MSLCKFKDIFGKPNEGAHKYRFMNLAIVDILLTLLAGYFIHVKTNCNLYLIWFILFFIGVIMHEMFCVNTQLNKILFNRT